MKRQRSISNRAGLSVALGGQALILKARGDLDGAMGLYKEAERLCREVGNPEGLAKSLANQAILLSGTPDCRGEARRLADEALAIATRHGYRQLVPQFQRVRDSISSSESTGGSLEVNPGGSVVGTTDNTAARISQAWDMPPTAHPSADANRAQQMNLQYQEEKKKWQALPWWKRIRTPKPKRPTGI